MQDAGCCEFKRLKLDRIDNTFSPRYENGEQEHCLELWNRDGKVRGGGTVGLDPQIRIFLTVLFISQKMRQKRTKPAFFPA